MRTLDEILLFLRKNKKQLPITTQKVADQFDLSRSVTSHYLNLLQQDKEIKKIDGRPVLWALSESLRNSEKPYSFDDFIGSKGSLKRTIEQCESAINYPPNGLSMIITGNSGVGKSFLAKEIYKYSISHEIIKSNAPFLTLNCADYANNPELLSSILFGYVKGAFTGAEMDKSGLLEQANGGYLFLDEVHRLSNANQEKLFNFIDSGEFRRVGENKNTRKSKVRLLFATTEPVNDVLLTTFKRRISITINLPDFKNRPEIERLNIAYEIFYQEAKRMGKTIKISQNVLNKIVKEQSTGNIGKIKNLIKVKCANAYKTQMNTDVVYIDESTFIDSDFDEDYVTLNPDLKYNFSDLKIDDELQQMVNGILKKLSDVSDRKEFELISTKVNDQLLNMTIPFKPELYMYNYLKFKERFDEVILNQYGIPCANGVVKIIYLFCQMDLNYDNDKMDNILERMSKIYPRSLHVTRSFLKRFNNKYVTKLVELMMTILLTSYVDDRLKVHGLLLAHGNNTATSIQSVVNQLCGEYVLDAIDMPIDTNIDEIVEKTKKLLDLYDTSDGTVMIVDMGSLNQIYSEVKNNISGKLLVIDNLTTAVALDVALKIQNGVRFKTIATAAETEYKIHSKYYSGFSNRKNIIISCISGMGISEKLKETMAPYFSKDIQINTIDYHELKHKIKSHDEKYFQTTFLILTTTTLPNTFKIPNINIYDLLDEEGEQQLTNILKRHLNTKSIELLNEDFVRFFSLEGISERLSFLNPRVILKEVEEVITRYENYYCFKLSSKVKLNFYMHIALMFERLMLDRNDDVPKVVPTPDEKKFIDISRDIFRPLERKYNVDVNDYELSLIYEVFRTIRS